MPGHTVPEPVIAPGCDGAAEGVMLPVVEAVLSPHGFVAVTDTVPAPVPNGYRGRVVAPPAVTAHPVPVTDQV